MFKPARLISASSVPMNSARSSIVIETNPSRIVALSSLASSSDHFTPSSIVFLPIGLACIFLMFLAIFLFHPVCSELGRNCIILSLNALTHCLSASFTPVKRESSSVVSRTFEQPLARRGCSAPIRSGSQCICATPVPPGSPRGGELRTASRYEIASRLERDRTQLILEVGFWFGIVSVPGAPRTERDTQHGR